MTWVVDTCVLLDLACNDKTFAGCASRAIQSKIDDVLTVAPLTYVNVIFCVCNLFATFN